MVVIRRDVVWLANPSTDPTDHLHIVPQVSRRAARKRRSVFMLAVGIAFASFLTLLTIIRRNHQLDIDLTTTLRVQRRQHPALTRLMNLISWPGFRPQSLIMPFTVIVFAALTGLRRDMRYLIAAWAASMISFSTKRLIQRPRPSGNGIQVQIAKIRDSSFPSGHVLHYTVFWGFVAYLWFSRVRGRWLRWGPVAAILAMIGSIGPSRIYLGHHWLTDVLASYSLGTGLLLSLIGLRQRKRRE